MSYVNSITIYPRQITMRKEDYYYNVRVEVCPSNADKDLIWAVSDESIIEYNQTGRYIYAKKNGTAYLRAYATDGSGVVGCCKVTVHTNVNIETITLDRTEITIEKGDCAILTASICPPNATNKSLRWYANHSNVSVENGVVRGLSEGTAIVTARARDIGSASATCTVHVTERILVNSIDLNFSTLLLDKGDTQVLYATVCPSNATDKSLNWYSSDMTTVHVNRHTGVITAQEVGTATITAVAADGSGVYAQCVVTVQQFIPVRAIYICDPCGPLTVGDEFYLNTSITPENATDQSLMWESSNPSVVSVGTYTGYISAVSRGTAVITARTFNGSVSKSISLTVSKEKVEIVKETDGIIIRFLGGTVKWKCINYDLELGEPLSCSFEIGMARMAYNAQQCYSNEQLAFIYLVDPLGLSYYLKNYNSIKNIQTTEDEDYQLLFLKDNVFELIFGERPKYYSVINDSLIETHFYNGITGCLRLSVYSSAEMIFGQHVIDTSSWFGLISSIFTSIFSGITNVIEEGNKIYSISDITNNAVNLNKAVKAYYYGKGASDFLEDQFNSWFKNEVMGKICGGSNVEFMNWIVLFTEIGVNAMFYYFESLIPPDAIEINMIKKLANHTYYVPIIISGSITRTLEEIYDFSQLL